MNVFVKACSFLILFLGCAAFGGEFTVERVFGPEVPTGPYKHPACLTELSNGDLYLVYYGGAGEYAVETGVFASRKHKGESSWSAPRAIARDPFRSVGNGVVWEAPDGLLWLFYVVRYGETWSTSRIQCKVSRDLGETWSDSSVLSLQEGDMVRNRPIVLKGGDYILPIYNETGNDPEMTGPDSMSLVLRYHPSTRVWTRSKPIRSAKGNIQPAVVELADGRLIAYCRRGGDYNPKTIGYIVRAESSDGGLTWTEGKDTAFPNPNAAVDLITLKSGRLFLVYNNSMVHRSPLSIALSSDQERTWPIRLDLLADNRDYGYPMALQAKDGRIHLVYTSDKRSVVNHAVLDEEWILGKAARNR